MTIRHVSDSVKQVPEIDALAKRREPEQERSRAGVASILDAAASLLDEHGIDQITMTAIAGEAGLSKAALYRYFPNKAAIIRSLAERTFEQDAQRVLDGLDRDGDGRQLIVDGMADYLDLHRKQPHRVQLRAAIRADPELSRLDVADSQRNAEVISAALAARGGVADAELLALRILLILDSADAVIRLAPMVDPAYADRITEEFLAMIGGRLDSR